MHDCLYKEFGHKKKQLEPDMKINQVKKILGEPNDEYQFKNYDGRELIKYYYETKKWYESKYEIIFNKEDSTIFIQGFEKM